MKTEQELKRNYLILFLILFAAGIIVILRSFSINLGILIYSVDGFDQNQLVFGCISWIVAGSILSLLSGYAIVNLLLRDLMWQDDKIENNDRK